jgi:hypothetical protein
MAKSFLAETCSLLLPEYRVLLTDCKSVMLIEYVKCLASEDELGC